MRRSRHGDQIRCKFSSEVVPLIKKKKKFTSNGRHADQIAIACRLDLLWCKTHYPKSLRPTTSTSRRWPDETSSSSSPLFDEKGRLYNRHGRVASVPTLDSVTTTGRRGQLLNPGNIPVRRSSSRPVCISADAAGWQIILSLVLRSVTAGVGTQ